MSGEIKLERTNEDYNQQREERKRERNIADKCRVVKEKKQGL